MFALVLITGLGRFDVPLTVAAQAFYQWSTPRQIPNYSTIARPPLLVADSSGNVHAFTHEVVVSNPGAIHYRRWRPDQGWSPPVDILIPVLGGGQQTVQGVYLDENGIIHLIYYDGNEEIGDVFYSHAYASAADRAPGWSKPVIIGTAAGPINSATLVGDGKGRLAVFYSGQQDGIGLYQVFSEDSGDTWSRPAHVDLISSKEQWPFSVKAEFDSTGRLHVVWSVVNTQGVGDQVNYARQEMDFGEWDHRAVLARREANDYSANWPTIISSGDEIIVIYQDSFPATRWMAHSLDGGQTWELPVRPFREIGEYENAILLKDSQGTIHMVLGNRTQFPEIHGMWYSQWVGNRWTALEPIISDPISDSFDPSAPQAVISQGNILVATWWHNVRREYLSGAWFSYTTLDAPAFPHQELPQPPPTPTARSISQQPIRHGEEPLPTPTIHTNINTDRSATRSPAQPVFLGMIPVVLLLALVITIRVTRSR
jgi:hypothetical protein